MSISVLELLLRVKYWEEWKKCLPFMTQAIIFAIFGSGANNFWFITKLIFTYLCV